MSRCIDINVDVNRCVVWCGIVMMCSVDILIVRLLASQPQLATSPLAQSQSTWGQRRGRRTHHTCPHLSTVVHSVVLAQWWQGCCCHVAHSDGSSQAVSRNIPSILSVWCRHCEVLTVSCCWPPDLGLLCCVCCGMLRRLRFSCGDFGSLMNMHIECLMNVIMMHNGRNMKFAFSIISTWTHAKPDVDNGSNLISTILLNRLWNKRAGGSC